MERDDGNVGGGSWGGRIGEQLGELDAGAREALRGIERAEPWRVIEDVIRAHPLVALGVAFGLGLLLAARREP